MKNEQWKPGDVAVATIYGVPDVRVFAHKFYADSAPLRWASVNHIQGPYGAVMFFNTEELVDLRRLYVFDLRQFDPTAVATGLKKFGYEYLADQLVAQVTPKIPEPKTFGALIRLPGGTRLVRVSDGPRPWLIEGGDAYYTWGDLLAINGTVEVLYE